MPALIWLWFWLHEDRRRPEPRSIILLTFIAGMVAVPIAIPLEKIFFRPDYALSMFVWWSAIEETLKFAAAYFVAVKSREMDEPVDALIYFITAALGFSAAENALFLMRPLMEGDVITTIMTGNLRFVGASLLHTLCSALIGASIALTFYRKRMTRFAAMFLGLAGAIALHTVFNIFIMRESEAVTFAVFGFVWFLVIALMLVFERVKNINPGE